MKKQLMYANTLTELHFFIDYYQQKMKKNEHMKNGVAQNNFEFQFHNLRPCSNEYI